MLGLQAFLRGLALENCGCFGVHLAQPLRWWVLLGGLELLLLTIFVLAAPELWSLPNRMTIRFWLPSWPATRSVAELQPISSDAQA